MTPALISSPITVGPGQKLIPVSRSLEEKILPKSVLPLATIMTAPLLPKG